MKISRIALAPVISLIVAACNHPIEIVGEGDVTSASGTRYCYLEDYNAGKDNCTKNTVTVAYEETYYATPRDGWTFTSWEGCLTVVNGSCSFSVPADAVAKSWGKTAPPLRAIFALVNSFTLDDVQGKWVGTGTYTAKLAPDQACRWSVEFLIEGDRIYHTTKLLTDTLPFIRCGGGTTEGYVQLTESGKLDFVATRSDNNHLESGGDGFTLSKEGRLQSQSEYVLSGVPYISVHDYGRP